MSRNSKLNRLKREQKEKKQGDAVVKWIFIALIFLALIYVAYSVVAVQ